MSVVDASIVVDALVATGDRGRACREIVHGEVRLHCPAIMRAEVASVLRRHELAGRISGPKARAALIQTGALAISEYAFEPFQLRIWRLRQSVSVYDAWYVALAEALDTTLVTSDERLARAPGPLCPIEVIGASGS